jgi:hypothetical protein
MNKIDRPKHARGAAVKIAAMKSPRCSESAFPVQPAPYDKTLGFRTA